MATTLFPTSNVSTVNSASWLGVPSKRLLSFTRGAPAVSVADGTANSLAATNPPVFPDNVTAWGSNGTNTQVNPGAEAWSTGSLIFISNPLNPVTIAGSITANARALEGNAKANYGACCFVYHLPQNGDIAVKFGSALNTTEIGTTEGNASMVFTPTSTDITAGGRLVVVFGWGAAGGTSASGNTATGFYNGASGATGDAFITFTETISQQSPLVQPQTHFVYQRKNR